jgi:IS30 family transposase
VVYPLRERFSPQQIVGNPNVMEFPNFEKSCVCRETIYNAIYTLPSGEFRKEFIICLRQGKTARRARSGGVALRLNYSSRRAGLLSLYVRDRHLLAQF